VRSEEQQQKGGKEQRAGCTRTSESSAREGYAAALYLREREPESRAQAVCVCMGVCVRVFVTYLHEKGYLREGPRGLPSGMGHPLLF
jgi:hypothetical protein